MAQKRFRKVRYSSVLARRAGIDEGTQNSSFPFTYPLFPAIKSREVTRPDAFFKEGLSARRSASLFPRKATGVVAVSGPSRVSRRTRTRTRERRGVRAASPSRLSTNTNARVLPRRDERALTFASTRTKVVLKL